MLAQMEPALKVAPLAFGPALGEVLSALRPYRGHSENGFQAELGGSAQGRGSHSSHFSWAPVRPERHASPRTSLFPHTL